MTSRARSGPLVVFVLLALVLATVGTIYALVPGARVFTVDEVPYLLDPEPVARSVHEAWGAMRTGDDQASSRAIADALDAGAVDPLAYLLASAVRLSDEDLEGFARVVADPRARIGQNDVPGRLLAAMRDDGPATALRAHLDKHPQDALAAIVLGHLRAASPRAAEDLAVARRLDSLGLPRAHALSAHLRARAARAEGDCETVREACGVSSPFFATWPPSLALCDPACP